MWAAALIWIVASPYVVGAAVSRWRPASRFVADHYWPSLSLGWLGVSLLMAGAFALDGTCGDMAVAGGGPLAGLSFWSRGRDDGWNDEPDDDAPPQPGLDWEQPTRDGGALLVGVGDAVVVATGARGRGPTDTAATRSRTIRGLSLRRQPGRFGLGCSSSSIVCAGGAAVRESRLTIRSLLGRRRRHLRRTPAPVTS